MNTPHKWAKEICHLANGHEIEGRKFGSSNILEAAKWVRITNFGFHGFDAQDWEFRIKPESVYRKTTLNEFELHNLYAFILDTNKYSNHIRALTNVANGAVERYIIDTEEKS
jgi:hypothetical protein